MKTMAAFFFVLSVLALIGQQYTMCIVLAIAGWLFYENI